MLIARLSMIGSCLMAGIVATWYSSEHKVCDPLGKQWTRFTGFKIHRQYVVKDLRPPMLHFVSLSHCENGELTVERLSRTGRETDVQWDKPICLFPPDVLKKLTEEEREVRKRDVQFPKFDSAFKSPHAVSPIHKTLKRKIKQKLGGSFNGFLRKMSSHFSFIEYVDDPLEFELESIKTISYENLTAQNLDDLRCYKLARRKKYALRELMVYAPYAFVGGIFECQISDADKQAYLDSLKDHRDFMKPMSFSCDPNTAIPLYPLLADDINNQWIERKKGLMFSQRIPYLYSPGSLDFRFGQPAQFVGLKSSRAIFKDHMDKTSGDKWSFDSWFKELEVNENYTYSPGDINVITQTVTTTANLMKQYLDINRKYLPWEWDSSELTGNKDSLTYLDHKVSSVISKVKNVNATAVFVKSVQDHWDSIKLTPEVFYYNVSEVT